MIKMKLHILLYQKMSEINFIILLIKILNFEKKLYSYYFLVFLSLENKS